MMDGRRRGWIRFAASLVLLAGCGQTIAEPTVGRAPPAPEPPPPTATAAASESAQPEPAEPPAAPVADGGAGPPRLDVIYWATSQPIVEKMLELAKTQSTDVVYDLGCGDARSVVTAATRYGARGVGVDLDSIRVQFALHNVERHRVEHLVKIEKADFFTVDLSDATVVFLFLLSEVNAKLLPQLEKLRPGARVVAHEFEVPGIKPKKVVRVMGPADGPPGTSQSGKYPHTIYLYEAPLQKQPPRR